VFHEPPKFNETLTRVKPSRCPVVV
jgi:hypothetical protein